VPLTPGVWTPRTPTSQLSETLVAANYDSPMTQQFSLDVQGQVLPATVLEVAYVGTRSTRLSESRGLNEAQLASPDNPISGITTAIQSCGAVSGSTHMEQGHDYRAGYGPKRRICRWKRQQQ